MDYLPAKLKNKLSDNDLNKLQTFLQPYSVILEEDRREFFGGYTDHGSKHIKNVLETIEYLIPENILEKLTSEEVVVMVISVALHDIGMQANQELFKNMIFNKEYDDACQSEFDEKAWEVLWKEYLKECHYWDREKKRNIFGDEKHIIKEPNWENLGDKDKLLIGEFIRKHHCRIAHEIALKGYIGYESISNNNDDDAVFGNYLKLAGVVARSHGMDIRAAFDYLENNFGDRTNPIGIHAVYLMALLRLADYLDITKDRTNKITLKIRKVHPFSYQEHQNHLATLKITIDTDDKEKIKVHAAPQDAQTHVKIERLVEDIQKEFDKSWAVLGEVYGNEYTLSFRRITTNISNKKYKENIKDYIPKQFNYQFNNELSKLLIAPLYGDNPSYGVRELVQNAVDACRVAKSMVSDQEDAPHVKVELDTEKNLFTITDTGIGMTLEEIEKYFLTIGSSYNNSIDWQKTRDTENIYRTGRFGIGVLAAYLLGGKITVVTKSRKEQQKKFGYRFTASLEDKFIEIKKEKMAKFGTKIEIECEPAVVEKLRLESDGIVTLRNTIEIGNINIKELGFNPWDAIHWYIWYIDKNPSVCYFCNGKKFFTSSEMSETKELEGFKKLAYSSEESFGEVYWKPTFIDDYWPILCCNGFLVTDRANKRRFSEDIINEYVWKFPNLSITDTYNQLPLNLRRDDIEKDVNYVFEQDLSQEVCKDLVCQFMAFDINMFFDMAATITLEGWENLSSFLRDFLEIFCYHFSGFTFCENPYIKRIITDKQMVNIFCLQSKIFSKINEIEKEFSKFPNYLFRFFFSDLEDILERNSRLLFRSVLPNHALEHIKIKPAKTCFAIKKEEADKDDIFLLEHQLRRIKDEYKDYWIYCGSEKGYIEKMKSIIDACGNQLKELWNPIIAIEEINTNTPQTVSDSQKKLDELFRKYLGEDPIIPYDMEARKEKFPTIFAECSEEIEKYRKIFQEYFHR